MRTNIGSEQHPPVVDVSSVVQGIGLDLVDRKESLLADLVFPMLNKVGPAERTRQKLSPGSMLARIEHSEDTSFREVGKPQVPFALHVFGANLVDLLESIEVCDSNFVW